MAIELQFGPVADLSGYVRIPNAFESSSVLDVIGDEAPFELVERPLDAAFRKDYDAVENPLRWPELFDVSNWVLVRAVDRGHVIGGAIAAWNTPEVDMLEDRADLIVLWDIRVAPEARRAGVGATLFAAVEGWGRSRACVELKVETQDVNVAACCFYQSRGCTLTQVDRHAYPQLPGEVQLIWRKRIARLEQNP